MMFLVKAKISQLEIVHYLHVVVELNLAGHLYRMLFQAFFRLASS